MTGGAVAAPAISHQGMRRWAANGGLRKLARLAGVTLLVLILAFLAVYPLTMLFYGSIHSSPPGMAGTFNLQGYRDLLTDETLGVLANTGAIAMTNTVISLATATALAFLIARTDTPYARQLEVLITLPFFMPPILTAMSWGMLGNPQVGSINQVWKLLTGSHAPIVNVYSYGGVIWHMSQYATPFLFLLIVDAFRAMDPSLEDAARMAGASRLRIIGGITLALMLPILSSAFLLSFIRGLEAFESALFFGTPARITVITTAIYDSITQRAEPEYQYATAISFAVMLFMLVLITIQWGLLRGRNFATVTGKGFTPRLIQLGRWRWLVFVLFCLYFFITFVLPVGQLIVGSFFRFFGFYKWSMVTLDHYAAVFDNDELWRGIFNTMILGLIGASATMVLGGIVAYIVVRTRWLSRRLVEGLAWLPWLMPGVVMGVGLLWAYAMLPNAIPIYGTIWALLLAYMALGTPLSVRIMSGAYAQLSYDLEECSRVHGATWWQTLWRVLVALAWPAFAVGWVLLFFGIMRELSASILLYAPGSEVLSVELLKLWTNGQAAEVSVVGIMTMVLVIVFRWVQFKVLNARITILVPSS